MSGPYFKGQIASQCGCFFPDVTRLRDDLAANKRVLHCIVHGTVEIPLYGHPSDGEQPIPTDEWREQERERLRARTT